MKASDDPIVVEESFNASIETVWRSITELDQMRQWFFENIPSFDPVVGFETRFSVHSGGREFRHIWKLTEVVPLKRISYDWTYDGYPGDSFVVFELFEQEGSTKLRLTATVRQDFPDDIPEFKWESCLGGWEYFLKDRLKQYIEGSVAGR